MKGRKEKICGVILGVVVLAIGIILGLNALGLTNINLFFDGWWTMFIIIPSLLAIINESEKIGGGIGLIIGILFLLSEQDILQWSIIWKLLVPIGIIGCGVYIIYKAIKDKEKIPVDWEYHEGDNDNKRSHTAIFGGVDMRVNNEVFDGADVTAIFGGVELDLRNAIFERNCVIDVTAVFGGVDIFLPDTVNARVHMSGIFGGASSKKHKNSEENTITVYIKGVCMFGGMEIK